jgi:hypothetical protein
MAGHFFRPGQGALVRRLMQAGAEFPPIRIRAWADAKYIVIDGVNRFAGSVLAGFSHIPTVVEGSTLSKMLPSLTDSQQRMVLGALRSLRLSAHDNFLLELASALARSPQPISDLTIKVQIRQLLGTTPIKDIVNSEVDA